MDHAEIAARDFFFVGGEYAGLPGKEVMHGQMYVEALTPRCPRRPYPVVMFHGAGQTATNWLGTPDGRPGWAEHFAADGYRVYLVDQPARGRSAWQPGIDGELTAFQRAIPAMAVHRRRRRARLAAGGAAQPAMAGQRPSGRPGFRRVPGDAGAVSRRRGRDPAAGAGSWRGAARPDRPGDPDDPFAIGHVRLDHRRGAARAGQVSRCARTRRAAVREHDPLRRKRPHLGRLGPSADLRPCAGGRSLRASTIEQQDGARPPRPRSRCWRQRNRRRMAPASTSPDIRC